MKLAFAVSFVFALLLAAVIPARADDLVYVNAWEKTWTYSAGGPTGTLYNPGAVIFWTFGSGLTGPYPTDPSAQDFANYGYALPFIEASYNGPNNDQVWAGRDLGDVAKYYASNTNVYFPLFGTFSDPNPTATFSGWVNLTDQDGFITGLPFEQNCSAGQCTNLTFPEPTVSTAGFNYLNANLGDDPPTPTPELPSLFLIGTGLLVVGFFTRRILRGAGLAVTTCR